ncbi:hypothetical protein [Pseudomonas sp. KBW05]|uniref:hypothetical protein n=1 Tax=Pseudomonas sp. KBW05 TaxID=2153360 RepID=UPI000F5A0425|nr:hypothetical protein [Pseudomonas sp. KBW05]RQO49852.1 hypothetical protein DBR46_23070 [Pseudomonas sp. KBW05]
MVFTAPVVKSVDDLKEYLENRFQVLYAGIAAQIQVQKMSPEESDRIMEMDAFSVSLIEDAERHYDAAHPGS